MCLDFNFEIIFTTSNLFRNIYLTTQIGIRENNLASVIIFKTKNWVHSPSIELVPPDNPKNTLLNNFDLMKKF